jgi:hypothetical protein
MSKFGNKIHMVLYTGAKDGEILKEHNNEIFWLLLMSNSRSIVFFVHSTLYSTVKKSYVDPSNGKFIPLYSLFITHTVQYSVLCRNYGSRVAAWLVLNSDLLVSEDDLRNRERLIEVTVHGINN